MEYLSSTLGPFLFSMLHAAWNIETLGMTMAMVTLVLRWPGCPTVPIAPSPDFQLDMTAVEKLG